jgi:C-terminal processing protease CtpA/Prc
MKYVIFLTIFLLSVNLSANVLLHKKTKHNCTFNTFKKFWKVLETEAIYKSTNSNRLLHATLGPEIYVGKGGYMQKYLRIFDENRMKQIKYHTPEEAWRIIQKYRKGLKISSKDACFFAIGGMELGANIKDPYTLIVLPNIKYETHTKLNDFGFDLLTYELFNRVFVDTVEPGSVAEVKGIKKFDEILSINGFKKIPFSNNIFNMLMSLESVINLVLKRKKKIFKVNLISKKSDFVYSFCRLHKKIPICIIKNFRSMKSYIQLLSSLKKLPKHKKRIIVDLRGNRGGAFAVYNEIASIWVGKKITGIIQFKTKNKLKFFKGTKKALLKGYKTVILTNHSTASVSETFIRTLRHYKLVKAVVGHQTFGKGVVQHQYYSNGISFFISAGYQLDLNMKKYLDEKIKPDFYTGRFLSDVSRGKDSAEEIAVDILNGKKPPKKVLYLLP